MEHLADGMAFEASDDLASGFTVLGAAFVVVLGAWVEAQAGLHYPVEGGMTLDAASCILEYDFDA
ncbi:hypothetical protein ACFVT2_13905 [Streptomyces sp. NPDC058000]|uniref:hypothetical protein n=1 Tax=Streptomyces sp. NPDC058000 TaxID=3346299 RepID=UPI0036E68636